MIKIDKGIPIPPKISAKSKYPLSEMEVGDSFFVPGSVSKATSIIHYRKLKGTLGLDTAFVTRAEKRGNETGIRVWRVA